MYVKRMVSFVLSIMFIGLAIFAYVYMSNAELSNRQKYVETQCLRKKNSTVAEVRGGNTVLYAMRNAAIITLFAVEEVNPNSTWIQFTRNLLQNTKWRIIGGAALQEMNATHLKRWASTNNIKPTERAANGGKQPLRYNRDSYFVIVENYPDVSSIGYDYFSDPKRKELVENGFNTGQIALSDPAPSIGNQDGLGQVVVFFIPVIDNNVARRGVSAGYYTSRMVPELAFNEDIFLRLYINGKIAYEDTGFSTASVRAYQEFVVADKIANLHCAAEFRHSALPLIVLLLGILGGLSLSALTSYIIHLMSVRLTEKIKSEEEVRIAGANEQAAVKSVEMKSAFLASVSHELRTPINGLSWMVNFLSDTPLTEDQRELVENLRISSESLLQIVDDVLEFSKIESGQLRVDLQPFELVAFLNEVALFYNHQSEIKNNAFVLRNDIGRVELWLISDRHRIKQILNNIVGNALKFTSNGTVTLTCDFAMDRLQFHVTDTGIGIDKTIISTLFQPYIQADASTTRKFGGTGLGLVISRRLAQLLGGDISCESTLGKGSTFHIHIRTPIAPVNTTSTEPASEAKICFSGHILVAEDNIINQKVIKRLLESMGLTLVIVDDGQKVIDLLDSGARFDLILMDGQMGIMDGYSSTKILRSKGYRIPIIGLTANSLSGERERCLAMGMSDFLSKPIVKVELVRALKRVLDPSTNILNDSPAVYEPA